MSLFLHFYDFRRNFVQSAPLPLFRTHFMYFPMQKQLIFLNLNRHPFDTPAAFSIVSISDGNQNVIIPAICRHPLERAYSLIAKEDCRSFAIARRYREFNAITSGADQLSKKRGIEIEGKT